MYGYNGASILHSRQVPLYIELEPDSLQSRNRALGDIQSSQTIIALLVLIMFRITVHIKNLNPYYNLQALLSKGFI